MMLDQVRRDLQHRLDDLLAEVDKLRRALAALGPGVKQPSTTDSSLPPTSRQRDPAPQRPARATAASASPKPAKRAGSAANGNRAGARAAAGATKSAVLAALASGNAMTASEVADATGLGRASVSTTLSKLAKTGEVTKAARGYQITR